MYYEVQEVENSGRFIVALVDASSDRPQAVVFHQGPVTRYYFDSYSDALVTALQSELNPLKLS